MISWKGAAALLLVLAALAYFVYQSRQPKAQPAVAHLIPCDLTNALAVSAEGPGGVHVGIGRPALREPWTVTAPSPGPANQAAAQDFVDSLYAVKTIGTVSGTDLAAYGLDHPREILSCRVNDGSSYTLTIGKESFDGSGYYALKGGGGQVYVISGVPVDEFDRVLKSPPYRAVPSASPSSSPTN